MNSEKSIKDEIKNNTTKLAMAIRKSTIEDVSTLITKMIDIRDPVLMDLAIQRGNLDIIKLLVHHCCPITQDHLNESCKNGHLYTVKFLHSMGLSLNNRDDFPMKMACRYNHVDVVEYLLDNGVDISISNHYPILMACTKGYLSLIRFLVSRGVDIHFQDEDPLFHACREGRIDAVNLLLSYGAKITPDCISVCIYNGYLNLVKILMNLSPINLIEVDLLQIIVRGHTKMLKWICEEYLVEIPKNALSTAVRYHRKEIVEMFLSTRSIPEDDLSLAIYTAAELGFTEILKILVKDKPEIPITAISIALCNGHKEIFTILRTLRASDYLLEIFRDNLTKIVSLSSFDECPICLEMYLPNKERIVVGCCFNSFCGDCISKISKTTKKCSLCREILMFNFLPYTSVVEK